MSSPSHAGDAPLPSEAASSRESLRTKVFEDPNMICITRDSFFRRLDELLSWAQAQRWETFAYRIWSHLLQPFTDLLVDPAHMFSEGPQHALRTRTKYVLPDHTILYWNPKYKQESFLLVEVKALLLHRNWETREAFNSAMVIVADAFEQVSEQARYSFKCHPEQKRAVVICAVGCWWRTYIFTNPKYDVRREGEHENSHRKTDSTGSRTSQPQQSRRFEDDDTLHSIISPYERERLSLHPCLRKAFWIIATKYLGIPKTSFQSSWYDVDPEEPGYTEEDHPWDLKIPHLFVSPEFQSLLNRVTDNYGLATTGPTSTSVAAETNTGPPQRLTQSPDQEPGITSPDSRQPSAIPPLSAPQGDKPTAQSENRESRPGPSRPRSAQRELPTAAVTPAAPAGKSKPKTQKRVEKK